MSAKDRYDVVRSVWSDVEAHLPRLFDAARGRVLELGVRHGVSTAALLAGVEQHGGHLWSVDTDPNCENNPLAGHPQWTFINAHSEAWPTIKQAMGGEIEPLDMLFIDTGHTYKLTIDELNLYGPWMAKGGRIFLHDTDDGSTFPGVRRAIYEYCGLEAMFWLYPGSYGLGEIQC